MRNNFNARACRIWLQGIACVLALSGWGCGSKPPPPPSSPDNYGNSIKASVYEFCAIARQQGIRGAKPEVTNVLENLEGYEEQHLGEHFGTYQQILERLTALKTQLSASMSNAELKTAIDEISGLADQLPGNANKNPALD